LSKLQLKLGSLVHIDEHPSPEIVLPSSH